ncbi:hypothetical protein AGMMS49579_00890 [Spirochaetia bacterium]|nr:hypothetical protein AGMMS49579_00890 [Spirochaetia bacterium]
MTLTINQMIFLSILFLIILFIYNKRNKKKGTWSNVNSITPYILYSKNKNFMFNENDSSEGERVCRSFLETIFKPYTFKKVRPSFLRNPVTKQPLELDCYNSKLKLAVEYNGRQHYFYTPFYHRNYDAFRNQQYRDEYKKRLCLDNNVVLIIVPYTVKSKDIPLFLNNKLKMYGYLN